MECQSVGSAFTRVMYRAHPSLKHCLFYGMPNKWDLHHVSFIMGEMYGYIKQPLDGCCLTIVSKKITMPPWLLLFFLTEEWPT